MESAGIDIKDSANLSQKGEPAATVWQKYNPSDLSKMNVHEWLLWSIIIDNVRWSGYGSLLINNTLLFIGVGGIGRFFKTNDTMYFAHINELVAEDETD